MEKYIIANIKMNQTPNQTKEYFTELKKYQIPKNVKIGVAVPFTSLTTASDMLKKNPIMLGAQNVFYEEKGAFTGEISVSMIKETGASFVIVGHSERRTKFGETNSFINKKIKTLMKYNMDVLLCVGEQENERASGKTKEVLTKQVEECLTGLYENELDNIIIAYEPVWAIGTGKSATLSQIQSALQQIKQVIAHSYSQKAAEKIKLIYGGSINKKNAKKFLSSDIIQGALVGGASLDPKEFCDMIDDIK